MSITDQDCAYIRCQYQTLAGIEVPCRVVCRLLYNPFLSCFLSQQAAPASSGHKSALFGMEGKVVSVSLGHLLYHIVEYKQARSKPRTAAPPSLVETRGNEDAGTRRHAGIKENARLSAKPTLVCLGWCGI